MTKEFLFFFAVGIVCGILYFAALWGSLCLLKKIQRKKTFLALTVVLRLFILLSVFFLIITHSQYGIFYTVAGFIIARIFYMKIKGFLDFKNAYAAKEEVKHD